MPVEAVLFDMDGTVIEFKFDVLGARKIAIETLKQNGVPARLFSEDMQTQQILNVGTKYLEQRGESSAPVVEEVYGKLERLELMTVEDPVLIPGAGELLGFLESRGIPMVLVTNSSERAALAVLSKLGLTGKFSDIVARHRGLRLKPNPDMILEALSRLSMRPSNLIYFVGDNWADMRAASAAGVSAIGFSKASQGLPKLLAAGAVVAFSRMKDVQDFLGSVL